MLFIIWTLVIAAAVTLYFRQAYSRFSKYGVKQLQPIPVFGNMAPLALQLEPFTRYFERFYYGFPNERFVGRYEFTNPMIMIKDLELVKKITVKDFEHFLDRREFLPKADPFIGRNLSSLKGQEWKDMRSALSPAFTSSKMRHMLPFMVEVGDQMVQFLKNKIKASGVGYVDIEGKDLTTRYTNDVIASCAFGLKVNSHSEENNEFYERGIEFAELTFIQSLKLFAFVTIPSIMALFKTNLFSKKTRQFFESLVLTTMRDREEHNIIRPDMIHLLMEAKKGKLKFDNKTTSDAKAGFATVEESYIGKKETNVVWSDQDLIAQAVIFFGAGFDTVSTTMSFGLHELTNNPDIQERLVQEIKENEIENGGKFDFNSIQNMTYMDMFVSEILRLWPPVVVLRRECMNDYNLGRANDKAVHDYIIRKGEAINIPVWCIHRDPQFFPDPLKFDPERFSEENKNQIDPLTYMPFGVGPRNCIGSRFALCEVKVFFYQLLQHFEISPCEKTRIPAVLSAKAVNSNRILGGQWMRLKLRQ